MIVTKIPKCFFQTVKAIKFSYQEILDCNSNLGERIEAAYGPKGLGICIVSDIPNYITMRQKLLPLSRKLATLPQEELAKLERPDAFYTKGWSCGVEKFKGKLDKTKGSFYNNPFYDETILSAEELANIENGKQILIPNVWPSQIPEMEGAFKNLGRLMIHAGGLLGVHIDKYIYSKNKNYEKQKLFSFIQAGDQHIARLLHYFEGPQEDEWCGWHNDHSALTALTCPIYMQGDKIVEFQDKEGGLMAKNRFADIVKVAMDPTCLAFQIGETAQIVSGGIVEATPHCVVRGAEAAKLNYNRNTFALFMAPKLQEPLKVPKGMDPQSALNKQSYSVPSLIGRWEEGIRYLEYSARTMKAYS